MCSHFSSFFKFMLREFETRRPQFDQLTQSAEGILSQTGDSAQDPKDLAEVRSELGSISQQWEDLTNRLTQRSNNIDQAQGTSERYQVSNGCTVSCYTATMTVQYNVLTLLFLLLPRPYSESSPPVFLLWVRGWTARPR